MSKMSKETQLSDFFETTEVVEKSAPKKVNRKKKTETPEKIETCSVIPEMSNNKVPVFSPDKVRYEHFVYKVENIEERIDDEGNKVITTDTFYQPEVYVFSRKNNEHILTILPQPIWSMLLFGAMLNVFGCDENPVAIPVYEDKSKTTIIEVYVYHKKDDCRFWNSLNDAPEKFARYTEAMDKLNKK